MRILLVSRIDNRDALVFAEKLRTVLEKEGSEVAFDKDTARISRYSWRFSVNIRMQMP